MLGELSRKLTADRIEVTEMRHSMLKTIQNNQRQYLEERWSVSPIFAGFFSCRTRKTADPTSLLWPRDRSP